MRLPNWIASHLNQENHENILISQKIASFIYEIIYLINHTDWVPRQGFQLRVLYCLCACNLCSILSRCNTMIQTGTAMRAA